MDKWNSLECEANREFQGIYQLLGSGEHTDWLSVLRRAESLCEIARRGVAHRAADRAREIGAFAMAGHSEREPR